MTTKVWARKIKGQTQRGVIADEQFRLTVNMDSDNQYEGVGFDFISNIKGISNISGRIAFHRWDGETGVTFTSGDLSEDVIDNFNMCQGLQRRLETCVLRGMTKEQIFADDRINRVLKAAGWQLIVPEC